ncbi:hypothetical protein V6R21_18900 [Limibacter armeniacum]|uniref:hypothetical protein n=1 Tax=Limibacter armeniacum TaxID=466084 RepID=UPI002FE65BFC
MENIKVIKEDSKSVIVEINNIASLEEVQRFWSQQKAIQKGTEDLEQELTNLLTRVVRNSIQYHNGQ